MGTNLIKLEIGGLYRIPDGYYPNGSSRPYRVIKLDSVKGRLAYFQYIDTKEKGTIPVYGIKYYHI